MTVAEEMKRCVVLAGAIVSLLLCVGCGGRMQTPTLMDNGAPNHSVAGYAHRVEGERVLGGRGSELGQISKDSQFILLKSGDGADRLVNLASGWSMDFRPSGDPMAFSPDSTTLAVARSHEIDFYDLETGKSNGSVKVESPGVFLEYSSDGSKLVMHHLKGLQMFDGRTGRELNNYDTGVMRGRFFVQPGGEHVVVHLSEFGFGAEDIVRVIDGTNGRIEGEFRDQGHQASVSVSPDGKFIAYEGGSAFLPGLFQEQLLVILDGADCGKLYSWKKGNFIDAMAFSGDSTLLAISNSLVNTIEVYGLENGSILHRIKANNRVKAIALSPDSRFLSVAFCKPDYNDREGGIAIYDLSQERMVYSKLTYARVERCEFLPNGEALVTSGDGGVEYIPLATFRQ